MRQRHRDRPDKRSDRICRKRLWLLVLCVAWPFNVRSSAQSASADELEIRAAMIFNLTRFIEWPASKNNPLHPEFVICILGSDPLAVNLSSVLQGKHVDAVPVVLRRLSTMDGASGCHIVYVGVSERKSLAPAAAELARNSVLTVSERSNAESPAQVIGLPTFDDHVRIDVNLQAARNSGLKMSSKLLRLATVTQ